MSLRSRLGIFVLTRQEQRTIAFIVLAVILGLITQHYRHQHSERVDAGLTISSRQDRRLSHLRRHRNRIAEPLGNLVTALFHPAPESARSRQSSGDFLKWLPSLKAAILKSKMLTPNCCSSS